jgi:acyl-CoA synthetase (AMP-forming)/AMP-acid ligase II/acyl carrier protein
MLEHGGITNIIFTSMDKFDFTSSDVLPSIAALSFDISLFELVTPLLAGGSSIILKRDEALDLERLTRLLDEATLLHTVPSLMRRLVTFLRENGLDLGGYKNIKRIFIGGDLVPPDLLREMQEIFASSQINVLYGPTEGTIICATHPVEKGRTPERHVIGRPLPNALLRLYDRDGNLVPVGVPGEIYVGGPGLSRGYFNRDELTSQKYVTIDGERFYRTGDLGRWLSDGNIEFLGRIDDQVKIRGNRVELNEVEAVLSQHPAVREAAVVARQDARQEKHLLAFVSANGGQQPTVGSLRSFIAERLPDYMIPSAFTLLDALPLTPHGKVDRRALQTLGGQGAELGEAYVAPQTELEQTIARIWREVLGVERVGTNDSFFDLGGHSLLIIQVHARLKEAISREVAVVDLFKFPTISALASHLSERREDSTTFEKVRERASQRRAAASNRQKIKRRGVGGHE